MLPIEAWNVIEKDSECNSTAIEGDLVEEIDGILFLVQRKNECNNIVCTRVEESDIPVWQTFLKLRKLCISHSIFYIRVEGTLKRYIFLKAAINKYFPDESVSIVQDNSIKDRNVFYIKLI